MFNQFRAKNTTSFTESPPSPEHEAFWAERLSTLLPLVLPYSKPHVRRTGISVAPTQTDFMPTALHGIDSVSVSIPKTMMTLHERYASHADLSMGDFLLTVFGAYLARLSRVSLFDLGFRDVALQQAVKGSKKRLASHVPLRVDVSGAQSFSDLLQSMQEELALIRAHKSYAHDIATRYPTLRSVPEWRPEQVWPVVVEQVEALWHMSLLSHQKAISPLTMVIPEGETKFRWVYDTQMLDQKQIAKMVQQFTIFLEGIAAHPDALLGELPLLPEEERHQLLVEFNDTAADYAQDRGLHQ